MQGYYFITDSGLSKAGNNSDVKAAVDAGVRIVQYRDKVSDSGELYENALILRQICKDITFLINDRIDVAMAVNADGVHIGQNDFPYDVARKMLGKDKIIGVTVHTVEEALHAEKIGADYLGVSPIYSTQTKHDAGAPGGSNLIRQVKKVCSLPIAAIGGITLDNAQEVVDAGADMICAISAVVCSDDPKSEIQKFQALFTN